MHFKYTYTIFSVYIEDLLQITFTFHASLILRSHHWNDSCTITNGSALSLLVIGFTYALIASENLSLLCLCLLPWFAQMGSALADLITGTIVLSFPRDSQYIGRCPTSWPLGSWPKTGPSFDSHVIRCASALVNGPDAGESSLRAKQTRRLTWCRAIALIGCVSLGERLCPGRAHSEQAIPSSCALQRPLPFPENLLSRNARMIWIHIQWRLNKVFRMFKEPEVISQNQRLRWGRLVGLHMQSKFSSSTTGI